MATANKGLEQPANGSNVDTWDVPVNGNFGIIDEAFGGVVTLTQTSATHTLADTSYRNLILRSTATLTGNVRYNIPAAVGGEWIVQNSTTGNFTFTIGTTNGAGTTVVIPQGQTELVYSDKLGNIRLARTTGERFPVGGIVMWSGTIANIPTGWFLCDGSNSTPDLRDKFIIGATQDDAGVAKTNITGSLTQTGGDKNAVLVSHTHTGTAESNGSHAHGTYNVNLSAATNTNSGSFSDFVRPLSGAGVTETNGLHTHNLANSTEGVSGTNANLPPYYALAYIMRGPY
jgi:hypothetical protein